MLTVDNNIALEILDYIKKYGGAAQSWYVGIAESPENRLFSDHAVKRNGDAWIYRNAGHHNTAREIEKYFLYEIGTKGGSGGGSAVTRYVYAYRIGPHTKE